MIFIGNPDARAHVRHGIPDDEFIRGEVPMTKSEVRSVVLSRLALSSDSVVYDVGAGTGSVSVECALAAYDGEVFAVEKEADAVDLIRQNKLKFRTDNLRVIAGRAPEALAELPAPTHAFIGGSSGNMRGIVSLILDKNPRCRIVAAAISLETAAELCAIMKETGFAETEVVCLNVSKARRAGDYNLMIGQNPVYIFTLQK